jgi:hypothetical protein
MNLVSKARTPYTSELAMKTIFPFHSFPIEIENYMGGEWRRGDIGSFGDLMNNRGSECRISV